MVGEKISGNLRLPSRPNLMKVSQIPPMGSNFIDLLSFSSELVSDDLCRTAVAWHNVFRLIRAEKLEDGYDASDII